MPTLLRLRGFQMRHKFMLISGLTLLPLAAVVLGVFVSIYLPVFDAIDDVVDETVNELIPANQLQTALLAAAMPPNDHLIHADPHEKETFDVLSARVYAAFEVVLHNFKGTAEERHAIEQAQDMWTRAEIMGRELLESPPDSPLAHERMERFDTMIDKAAAKVEIFNGHAVEEVREHAVAMRALKNQGIVWTLTAFALALALGLGGSLVLTHDRHSLEETSERDPLTGVYNRRGLEVRLQEATEKSLVIEEPAFTLLMFDIDLFKAINDTHGHQVGDEVLKTVARTAREHLRDADIFGRYGGDEFVLLLDDLTADSAKHLAERLRAGIEQTVAAQTEDGQPIHVTVTGGYATYPEHADTIEALIEHADEALYAAKEAGRNQMFAYHPSLPT